MLVWSFVLETFIDRGQMRKLVDPTVLPNGKRIPGLKLNHPRATGADARFGPLPPSRRTGYGSEPKQISTMV